MDIQAAYSPATHVVDLAVHTALGTFSCTVNPLSVANQIIKAAQSLEDARAAAEICEEICKDIRKTIINRLPVLCEYIHLSQLFPGAKDAIALNHSLLKCIHDVCEAIHEARIAVYRYLVNSRAYRMMQAQSVKQFLEEKRKQLENRFGDLHLYMTLSNNLQARQNEREIQRTAAIVSDITRQVEVLRHHHMRKIDSAFVRDVAEAALEIEAAAKQRRAPEGQLVKVSSPHCVLAMSRSGECFTTVLVPELTSSTVAACHWDAGSGKRMQKRQGHVMFSSVKSIASSPNSSIVAIGTSDGTAALCNVASGHCIQKLHGHNAAVNSVAWSRHCDRVATASSDKTAAVWNVETGERLFQLHGHGDAICAISWSFVGAKMATGSAGGVVFVWDAASGGYMYELPGHSNPILSVAWSPDERQLATSSSDGSVSVCDVATRTSVFNLHGHSDAVLSIAWGPHTVGSRPRLATGSRDSTARIWDALSGAQLCILHGHSAAVCSVVWCPDGRELFTASGDGSVRVYNVLHTNHDRQGDGVSGKYVV